MPYLVPKLLEACPPVQGELENRFQAADTSVTIAGWRTANSTPRIVHFLEELRTVKTVIFKVTTY